MCAPFLRALSPLASYRSLARRLTSLTACASLFSPPGPLLSRWLPLPTLSLSHSAAFTALSASSSISAVAVEVRLAVTEEGARYSRVVLPVWISLSLSPSLSLPAPSSRSLSLSRTPPDNLSLYCSPSRTTWARRRARATDVLLHLSVTQSPMRARRQPCHSRCREDDV